MRIRRRLVYGVLVGALSFALGYFALDDRAHPPDRVGGDRGPAGIAVKRVV